jgi:hypothetical protein
MFKITRRSNLDNFPHYFCSVSEQRAQCAYKVGRDFIPTKQSIRNEVSDAVRFSDSSGNILGCARNPATNYLADYRSRPLLASQGINEFGNRHGA